MEIGGLSSSSVETPTRPTIHYNTRKATISFVMSACPSVRPYVCTEQLGSHWKDFHEILYFWHISKIRRENSSFIKIWRYQRPFYMTINIHFWWYLAQFFLEREMFRTEVVQKIKTHILCSITFFPRQSCRFRDKVEKIPYSRTGHRWQYGACALHAGYLRL